MQVSLLYIGIYADNGIVKDDRLIKKTTLDKVLKDKVTWEIKDSMLLVVFLNQLYVNMKQKKTVVRETPRSRTF